MISIIIPAYNEDKRIGKSLLKIREYLNRQNFAYEIIVVDDGSTDNTKQKTIGFKAEIKDLRIISYPTNKGKGYALRQGVLASNGELVLLSDADLSTPIEELSHMLSLITNSAYDVVIGSRALKPETIIKKQPWWRQGMGKIFNRIVKLLVLEDFDDTQCGFKLFSGKAARGLFKDARIDRFAFDVEILALAKKKSYRVSEVPVRWINSPASKVHPVFDSLQMLCDLIRIRLRIGKRKTKCPSTRFKLRRFPDV
ncbi:MAG: glycosyltransferase family 2 protein [Desulfobacterales bacterium]|jgi:dolichyl-phosphate beta-glucosyltransferase